MKYCGDCGYECADNAKFCGLCGFAFGEMMVQQQQMQPQMQNMQQQQMQPQMQNIQQQQIQPQMQNVQQQMQPQMQPQMRNTQQQQWKQTEQQVNAQKNTLYIRNIWSLVAAILCLVPFFMDEFAVIEVLYYEITDNFIEFCKRYGDLSFCTSLGEKMVACVIAVLPLLIFALAIVLVIGAFKAMNVIRGYLVTISIMATILMFFFVLGESGGVTFGKPLWILFIGLVLSAISCTKDKPKSHIRPGTLTYDENTSEGKKEWRCPKCDTRNSADYKFCKTCGTSRS